MDGSLATTMLDLPGFPSGTWFIKPSYLNIYTYTNTLNPPTSPFSIILGFIQSTITMLQDITPYTQPCYALTSTMVSILLHHTPKELNPHIVSTYHKQHINWFTHKHKTSPHVISTYHKPTLTSGFQITMNKMVVDMPSQAYNPNLLRYI